MYRGRHRHEPQRDTALTRVASALMRHAGDGSARAVLRRHLRLAPHRLPLRPGHARRARPPLRLRVRLHGRARPVRLPAAVAARQRLVLAQARPRGARSSRSRQADLQLARVDERRRRRRRVPRRARGDRDGRPLAGARHRHDRAAGRARRARGARPGALRRARSGPRRRRAADRRLPLPARRDGLRAARVRARRDARVGRRRARWRSTASTSCMWLERDAHDAPREGVIASPRARRAALRPGRRRCATRAARAGASTARSR